LFSRPGRWRATDEFDVDTIAELALPIETSPRLALDLLFGSVQGEPGSRYYNLVERRTRCVTIHYADRMHIGLTAGVLWMPALPRTSVLFHHKPDDEFEPTYRLLANPWGFAAWFKEQTPVDHAFAAAFAKRRPVKGSLSEPMAAPTPLLFRVDFDQIGDVIARGALRDEAISDRRALCGPSNCV
jgi:hypothetical protein